MSISLRAKIFVCACLALAFGSPSLAASSTPPGTSSVPGQVIVKFKSKGPQAVTECARTLFARGRPFKGATADRSASLDMLMRTHKVISARDFFEERAGLTTEQAKVRIMARLKAHRYKSLRAQQNVNDPVRLEAIADRMTNVYVLDVPAGENTMSLAAVLAKDPHVEYASPNYVVKAYFVPNDPYYASAGSWGQTYDDLWGLKKMNAGAAWDMAQGEGAVVAVVDTGLDYNHPDIAANVWNNPAEIPGNRIDDDGNGFIDDVRGWNFVANTNDPMDGHGHGTHVSGTIAAVGHNGLGVVGLAPRAKIMPLKGIDNAGNGTIQVLARALVYAAQNGADVISNSWGCSSTCPSNPVAEDAVRTAMDLGSVVVFAAGNSVMDVANISPQNMTDHKPIVVAASMPDDGIAPFSNFGRLVDVAAPGSGLSSDVRGILSLKSAVCSAGICPSNLIVGSQYLRQGGTSMACPHVSGLAALLIGKNPGLTVDQVRLLIQKGAVDKGPAGHDAAYGWGVVNAQNSLGEGDYRLSRIMLPAPDSTFGAGNPIAIWGTAAAKNFMRYEIAAGAGSNPASWQTTGVTLTGGQASLGLLGTWVSDPGARGIWTIRVRVYDAGGVTESRTAVVLAEALIEKNGWPQQTFDRTLLPSDTNVADLDGDGHKEVIMGDKAGNLYAWQDTGRMLAGFPVKFDAVSMGTTSPAIITTAAIGNLDGNLSDKEIAVAAGSQVHVFKKDGTELPGWPKNITTSLGYNMSGVSLGDLDNDGNLDVIFCDKTRIYAYRGDGLNVPGWPQMLLGTWGAPTPSVGDIDGDGKAEVVAANYGDGYLYAWEGDGSLMPGFPVLMHGVDYSPVLGDLDGDGQKEIVVVPGFAAKAATPPVYLTAYRSNGTVMPGWPAALPTKVVASPILADLNNDGAPEVIVVNQDTPQAGVSINQINVIKSDGIQLAGWPRVLPGIVQLNRPVVADAGGQKAVIVSAEQYDAAENLQSNVFYAFNAVGDQVPGWPRPILPPVHTSPTSPVITDMDGDGRLELIAPSFFADTSVPTGEMHAWALNAVYDPHKMDWPMGGQNPMQTHVLDVGVAPVITKQPVNVTVTAPAAATFSVTATGVPTPTYQWMRGAGGAAFTDIPGATGSSYTIASTTTGDSGTQYKCVVRNSVLSVTSSAGTLTVNPAPPAGLTATAGDGQVALSWTASSGAASYTIYRTPLGGSWAALASGLTGTAYVDTAVTNGTRYYYYVKAYNGTAASPNSTVVNALPNPPPPAAPAGFKAIAGNAQVALSWTASSGAASYTLYRLVSGGTWTAIASSLAGTAYTDTSVTNGTTYNYVVKAVNAGGISPPSTVINATPNLPAPPAPTGVTATAGNAQVALSWTASSGATSYTMYRTPLGGSWAVLASGLTGTAYTDTAVTNGTRYYYYVRAYNGSAASPNSTVVAALPNPPPPAAPGGFKATAGNAQVALSWTASNGAVSYTVYRLVSGGSWTAIASSLAGTAYTDTSVTNGTTYNYIVKAVNAGGMSPASAVVNATPNLPAPAAPAGLKVTAGVGQVSLSWTASAAATSYSVHRAPSGGTWAMIASGLTNTTYTDTAVTSGTVYYYFVRAYNGTSPSANSATVGGVPK